MVDEGGPLLGVPGQQAEWGLDPTNPYEGKVSLRVKGYARKRPRRVRTVLAPYADTAKRYVLSAWMRTDRAGAKVKFLGGGYRVEGASFGEKEFTLTTEWQRYHEVGIIPAAVGRYHSVGIGLVAGSHATVWIDALQLEEGERPTAFEP